jgi:hypothetical protein
MNSNFSDFQVAQVAEDNNTKRIVLTLQSTRHGSRGAGRFDPVPISYPCTLCLRKSQVFVSLRLKSLITGRSAFIHIEGR